MILIVRFYCHTLFRTQRYKKYSVFANHIGILIQFSTFFTNIEKIFHKLFVFSIIFS